MILLDENIPENQRQLLRGRGIRVRQIGHDLGRKGMKDEEIIPFLLQCRRPALFTLDSGFYRRILCHSRYSLVSLRVCQYEAAAFVGRLLKHSEFDTDEKRLGAVIHVTHIGLSIWRLRSQEERFLSWTGR